MRFTLTVKDDGTAVIERFYGSLRRGLQNTQNAANAANGALGNNTRGLQGNADAAGRAARSNGDLALRWGALLLVGTQVRSMMTGLVNAFTTYEDGLNRLKSKTLTDMGINPMFGEMKTRIEELALSTRYLSSEIAHGMSVMAQAGMTAGNILKNIKPVLDLATNEMIGLEQAAKVALTVQTSLKDKSADLGRVLDILAAVSSKSRLNLLEMGESWKYIGAQATYAGLSVEKTAAILGTFGETSVAGSMGGTAFRNMLVKLIKPSQEGMAVLKDLGMVAQNGALRYKNVGEAIVQVMQRMHQANNEGKDVSRQLLDLFGTRFVGPMSTLVREYKTFQRLEKEAMNSFGENARMAQVMMQGLTGEVKILTAAWDLFKIQVVDTFGEEITNVVKNFSHNLGVLTDALKEFKAWRGQDSTDNEYWAGVRERASMLPHRNPTLPAYSTNLVNEGALSGNLDFTPTPGASAAQLASAASSARRAAGKKSLWERMDPRGLAKRSPAMSEASSAAIEEGTKASEKEREAYEKRMVEVRKSKAQDMMDQFKSEMEHEEKMKALQLERLRMENEMNEVKREGPYDPFGQFEDSYNLTQERLTSINDLFLAAANDRERVLFESNNRTSSIILQSVQAYKEAALKEFGVARARRALMTSIAIETASSLVSIFVKGEEGRFKAAKMFASAEALVNAHQAASQVLADKFLPTPLKIGAAAAIYVAGLARVREINSVQPAAAAGAGGGDGGGGGFDFSGNGGESDFDSRSSNTDPGSIEPNRGSGYLNLMINVDGFVGNEAQLGSIVSEAVREAVKDGLNFGLQVNRS